MTQVLALVGSLRAASVNLKLAHAAQAAAPAGSTVTVFPVLSAVPFYSEDLDVEGLTGPAAALRAAIAQADAVLLVTPEYNGTLPAALKNALDWASRPWGAAALQAKPVAVISTSIGASAGELALGDARKVVGVAGGRVVDDAVLSIGVIGTRFAEVHPRDDADVVREIGATLQRLVDATVDLAAA